jgi:hypothetical protein
LRHWISGLEPHRRDNEFLERAGPDGVPSGPHRPRDLHDAPRAGRRGVRRCYGAGGIAGGRIEPSWELWLGLVVRGVAMCYGGGFVVTWGSYATVAGEHRNRGVGDYFDFNNDTSVNPLDYAQFRQRFGKAFTI